MGRIKDLLIKIANRAKDEVNFNVSENLLSERTIVSLPSNQEENSLKVDSWVMPTGQPRTPEEIFEDNRLLVASMDYGVNFILDLIDELEISENSFRETFIGDRQIMKLWFAHIAYKNKITVFSSLIKGMPTTNKRIKCITDLPLQKSLLN